MAIDSSIYTHPQDEAALKALQAIPGFTQVLKAFMKVWTEKQAKIEHMSSNIRLGETQLKKYYDMLPPICEKLGIAVPELYLAQDGDVNAWTAGDTNPYIVITTGLLKAIPEELIPTVLAHECGHIACHHNLYTTMGTMILNGALEVLNIYGIGSLVSLPLKVAFFYWMRCSEYSADRAAIICDGSAEKLARMCMYFAGYDQGVFGEPDMDVFMEQAVEYKAMIESSTYNKTLEFIMFADRTHPLCAVRAYEAREWANGPVFPKILRYIGNDVAATDPASTFEIPMPAPSSHYIGKDCNEVIDTLRGLGFTNIVVTRSMTHTAPMQIDGVIAVSINQGLTFAKGDWFPVDASVVITYYRPPTEEEIAAAHPGEIKTPDASRCYVGKNYQFVAQAFAAAGFTNIMLEEYKIQRSWLATENNVTRISIAGQTQFDKGSWYKPDAEVRISYQTFIS